MKYSKDFADLCNEVAGFLGDNPFRAKYVNIYTYSPHNSVEFAYVSSYKDLSFFLYSINYQLIVN